MALDPGMGLPKDPLLASLLTAPQDDSERTLAARSRAHQGIATGHAHGSRGSKRRRRRRSASPSSRIRSGCTWARRRSASGWRRRRTCSRGTCSGRPAPSSGLPGGTSTSLSLPEPLVPPVPVTVLSRSVGLRRAAWKASPLDRLSLPWRGYLFEREKNRLPDT